MAHVIGWIVDPSIPTEETDRIHIISIHACNHRKLQNEVAITFQFVQTLVVVESHIVKDGPIIIKHDRNAQK